MTFEIGQEVECRNWKGQWMRCELIRYRGDGLWQIKPKKTGYWSCHEHSIRPLSALYELAKASE